MKRKLWWLGWALFFAFMAVGVATAASYAWRDHAAPFDFLFGNHIDTHQQSKLNGTKHLKGFFYITFTGEETDEGVPIARHGNCSENPDACTVGWMLDGVPLQATLLSHPEGQHPQWCVDAADLPQQPGYSHFHWLDAPEHAHELVVGDTYDGYLLKLTAQDMFFFDHHGGFLITPGIDTESHANITTDCTVTLSSVQAPDQGQSHMSTAGSTEWTEASPLPTFAGTAGWTGG